MNAYVLDSVAHDRWWAVLQRAWMLRFAAPQPSTADDRADRERIEVAARLRERIRAYEHSQPSFAADLAAALAQLERESTAR